MSLEESMKRKPDNDIDKIKRKHMIVENLKFPKSNVIDIDATQPLEQEIEQIYTYIEDYFFKKNPAIKDKRQEFVRQIRQIDSVETDRISKNKKDILERDNNAR